MSSCFHCGAALERHTGAELRCVGSASKSHTFDSLDIPNGKTCGDCVHIYRCKAIFGHTETDTYCGFYPRRFQEKPIAQTPCPGPLDCLGCPACEHKGRL